MHVAKVDFSHEFQGPVKQMAEVERFDPNLHKMVKAVEETSLLGMTTVTGKKGQPLPKDLPPEELASLVSLGLAEEAGAIAPALEEA